MLAVPDRSFATPQLCLYLPSADPALPELPLGCAPLQVAPLSIEALD